MVRLEGFMWVKNLCLLALIAWLGQPAPVRACSGAFCDGQITEPDGDIREVPHGGVLVGECEFCREETDELTAVAADGSTTWTGGWQRFGPREQFMRDTTLLAWVPDAPLPAGDYTLQGPGAEVLCEASPSLRVLPAADAVVALAPTYELAWLPVPDGEVVECVWFHSLHCGPRRVSTRIARLPHVLPRLEGVELDASQPARVVRVVGEAEDGPVYGPWVDPRELAYTADIGRDGAPVADDRDPGVTFHARQAEYCVTLEVLDLLTGDNDMGATTCLADEQPPTPDGPAPLQRCDYEATEAGADGEPLVRAYCRDNAADCAGETDDDRCRDYREACATQGGCAVGGPGGTGAPLAWWGLALAASVLHLRAGRKKGEGRKNRLKLPGRFR